MDILWIHGEPSPTVPFFLALTNHVSSTYQVHKTSDTALAISLLFSSVLDIGPYGLLDLLFYHCIVELAFAEGLCLPNFGPGPFETSTM